MSQYTAVFARLAKVDEAKRQVTGIIASETPDAANEVFDYDSSKPHFEKWSGEVAKASDGKSVGNVRAMHGKVAAGRLTDMTFDDLGKSIEVVADIVDDNEWEKVQKGVYTGFSIGGKYGRKWTDPLNKSRKRYTAVPSEVSLVDLGCNGDATFTMVKADGMEEQVAFHVPGQDDLLAKIADAESTDAERGEAIKQLAKLHHIALGVTGDDEEEALNKGAYSIGQLARLAEDAMYIVTGYGCNIDGTMTAFSDDVKKGASALYDGLLKMVNADVDQAKAKLKEVRKMLEDEGEDALSKMRVDFDNAAGNLSKIMEAIGMEEGSLIEAGVEAINKLRSDADDLNKKLDSETSAHEATRAELAKLKEQPAPAKGAVKPVAVSKESDGDMSKVIDDSVKPDAKQDPLALVKAAHASGGHRIGGGAITKVGQ